MFRPRPAAKKPKSIPPTSDCRAKDCWAKQALNWLELAAHADGGAAITYENGGRPPVSRFKRGQFNGR